MYRVLLLSLLSCATSVFVSPSGSDVQGCGRMQNFSCFSFSYALNISSFVELLPGRHFFTNITLRRTNISIVGVADVGENNSSSDSGRISQVVIDANSTRLFTIEYSSVIMENIIMTNSASDASGPALFVFNSNITLINCVICNCTAIEGGGAIYAQESELNVFNSSFLNNTSVKSYGGVMVIEDGSVTRFLDSYFIGNKCLLWGGAIVPEGNSSNTFINCYFGYNVAACCGGAIDDGDRSRNFYLNTTFEYNQAGEGGAYYNFAQAVATFDNCRFFRNQAVNTAGVIYSVSLGGMHIARTQFIENSARSGQDAIRCVNAGFLTMDTCVFAGHYGTQRFSMLSLRVSNTTIKNTSFINNTATSDFLINFVGGVVFLDQCNFLHNTAIWLIKVDSIMHVTQSDFRVNILGDSLFVVTSEGDLTLSGSYFYGMRASGTGAIVRVEPNVQLQITNCSFVENRARAGGVLDVKRGANVSIVGSLFKDNFATEGGGVIITEEAFVCRQSRFLNNSARFGGVIQVSKLIRKFSNCSSWLHNCELANNSATEGGVILWEDRVTCLDILDNCSSTDNKASSFGPVLASRALAHLQISRTRIEVYPGEKFSLQVLLQDDFKQIMRSPPVPMLTLSLENASHAFLALDYETADQSLNEIPAGVLKGSAQFVDVMLFADVGNYQLLLKADTMVAVLDVVLTECPEEFPALSRDPVFACLLDARFLRWEYILLALLVALMVTCCLVYRASGKRSPIYWPPKLKLFLQEVALVWLTVLIELVDTITDMIVCVYSWIVPELRSVAGFYAGCFVLIVLSSVITVYTNIRDLRVLQKHIRESRAEEDKEKITFTMHEVVRRRTTEATPAQLPTENTKVTIARMEREKTRCLVRVLCGFLEDVPMGIISLRSVVTLEEVPTVLLMSLVLNCVLLGMKVGSFQRWRELSISLIHLKQKDDGEQTIAFSTAKDPKDSLSSSQQLAVSLSLAEEKPQESGLSAV